MMMHLKAPASSRQVSCRPRQQHARVQRPVACRGTGTDADVTQVPATAISITDAKKVEEMLARWRTFDADGNGLIDREELRQLLESTDDGSAVMFSEHWLPEEELDRVMAEYDKDKNGAIDYEEFKQIVYDGLLLDGKLSEYEEAFMAVDSSGNGTIGATELAELFRNLGTPISYEKLVDVMQLFDKDESGQIEFNEFLLMFRDHLFDLKAVQHYMAQSANERSATASMLDRSPTASMLDAPEGDIALIFSEKEFDEVLAASALNGKLVVLFCALTWCRPCKGMQRPAQRLADAYKSSTIWVKLFGNSNRQTKSLFKDRLKIRSTPSWIIYKGHEVVHSQTGTNKAKLENGIREALDESADLPQVLYPMPQELVEAAP